MEAFAQAMIDALAQPTNDIRFQMRTVGGPLSSFSCREFMSLRPEEEQCIQQAVAGLQNPKVLDIGCGIGRHLQFVRNIAPHALLTGVEISGALREVCLRALPGSAILERFSDVPDDARFDLVLLMGGGLGVFGAESNTQRQLGRIQDLLEDGGYVLLETGNPFGGDFHEAHHEIVYRGAVDGPFSWGYATRGWVQRELARIGFSVRSIEPISRPGGFYICHARKPTTQ